MMTGGVEPKVPFPCMTYFPQEYLPSEKRVTSAFAEFKHTQGTNAPHNIVNYVILLKSSIIGQKARVTRPGEVIPDTYTSHQRIFRGHAALKNIRLAQYHIETK
jgi:hypothetical protein